MSEFANRNANANKIIPKPKKKASTLAVAALFRLYSIYQINL
ncbi:MAG: hypothetical protein ACFFCZ_21610 [Promethearchaeota archaeon]